MKRFILIINGPSGVGKSTVSHILSRKYRKCAHVDVALLRRFVPNHKLDAQQIKLAYKNAADVTGNCIRAGYRVIVDGVFSSGRDIRRFLSYLDDKSVPVYLYTLSGDLAVIQQRDAMKRGTCILGPIIKRQFSSISAHSRSLGVFIDTTSLAVVDAVERVRELFRKGEGLIAGEAK